MHIPKFKSEFRIIWQVIYMTKTHIIIVAAKIIHSEFMADAKQFVKQYLSAALLTTEPNRYTKVVPF